MNRAGYVSFGSHRVMAIVWLVSQFSLSALGATNVITRFNVRIWQMDDGLPHNEVHAIAQSGDGYLWVGTREGLARFDGMRFTPFDIPAVPELKRGLINALCVTRDGSLWIAAEGGGLIRLKDGTISHFSEADGLANNQPRCLLEAKEGSLWIGSEGGVSRYKDGKFTNGTVKNGLGNNNVKASREDQQGTLRMATARGLSRLNPEGK